MVSDGSPYFPDVFKCGLQRPIRFSVLYLYHHVSSSVHNADVEFHASAAGVIRDLFGLIFFFAGHNVKKLANMLCKVPKACNIWKRRPTIEFRPSVLLFSPKSANLRNFSKLLLLIGQMVAQAFENRNSVTPKRQNTQTMYKLPFVFLACHGIHTTCKTYNNIRTHTHNKQ